MTDENPETGGVDAAVMERVLTRVTRLKCGECDYDKRDTVANHDAHRATHQKEDPK